MTEFTRLPGVSIVRTIQFRPFTGSSCTWRESTLPPSFDWVTSTSGAAPVTVIDSFTDAIVSLKLIRALCPTSNSRFSRRELTNPASSAVIRYMPGRIAPIRYCPAVSVTPAKVLPVSTWRAVTVTPGSAASVASVIVPLMLTSCA